MGVNSVATVGARGRKGHDEMQAMSQKNEYSRKRGKETDLFWSLEK